VLQYGIDRCRCAFEASVFGTFAMPDVIYNAMSLIAGVFTYGVLAVLAVVCVLAISIVQNRLEEIRFVEQMKQRNGERTAMLGSAAANPKIEEANLKLADDFKVLWDEANTLNATVWSLNYKRMYGDQNARDDPRRWADRFHANSDATNLMIIGICACPIALCGARLLATITARAQHKPAFLELFYSVTVLDIFMGMLTGLLATFVMKSGSSILSKSPLGSVDVSNPYGVAFVAALAGLFMDKFYSWFEPLLATGK
jgi:hypothetical protein